MSSKVRLQDLTPSDLREKARNGTFTGPTAGLAPGMTQVNVVIVPRSYAFHFLLYCQRNPKPCPVLEVIDSGEVEPVELAPGADIRTDCPRYLVFRHGHPQDTTDLRPFWRDDLVTFLLGCSFTFESALAAAGVPVRHVEQGCNVPMYATGISTKSAGPFGGPLVVTMRPIPPHLVSLAVRVTAQFPKVHGAPIHVGDPTRLGIRDLSRPDFGDPVAIQDGEIPVFWACGVTPQVALRRARLELAITHAPGHMFVTDVRDEVWRHL